VETKEEAMKHVSRSVALTGLAVSLVASLGAVSPHAAVAECSSKAAGTYLMTFTQGGTVTGSNTFRLGDDGTVSAVDSLQGTVGFTEAQGSWDCQRKALVATTLDFTTDGTTLTRADYVASVDNKHQTLTGTKTLVAFPLGGNPFTDQGTPAGSLTFTGVRIPPSVE